MVRRDPRPPVLARDAQPVEQIGQRLVLGQLEAHHARLERPRNLELLRAEAAQLDFDRRQVLAGDEQLARPPQVRTLALGEMDVVALVHSGGAVLLEHGVRIARRSSRSRHRGES